MTTEFSDKQVASPVVTRVSTVVRCCDTRESPLWPSCWETCIKETRGITRYCRRKPKSPCFRCSHCYAPHTNLCWPVMQGMKDTQILHTTSDVSSDSPSHAKVEEQSSFKVYSEKMLLRGRLFSALRSSFDNFVCFTVDAAYWRFKRLTRSKITHYGKSGNT